MYLRKKNNQIKPKCACKSWDFTMIWNVYQDVDKNFYLKWLKMSVMIGREILRSERN